MTSRHEPPVAGAEAVLAGEVGFEIGEPVDNAGAFARPKLDEARPRAGEAHALQRRHGNAQPGCGFAGGEQAGCGRQGGEGHRRLHRGEGKLVNREA